MFQPILVQCCISYKTGLCMKYNTGRKWVISKLDTKAPGHIAKLGPLIPSNCNYVGEASWVRYHSCWICYVTNERKVDNRRSIEQLLWKKIGVRIGQKLYLKRTPLKVFSWNFRNVFSNLFLQNKSIVHRLRYIKVLCRCSLVPEMFPTAEGKSKLTLKTVNQKIFHKPW